MNAAHQVFHSECFLFSFVVVKNIMENSAACKSDVCEEPEGSKANGVLSLPSPQRGLQKIIPNDSPENRLRGCMPALFEFF